MGSLESVADVALALSLLLVAGRLGASAARRLGQPTVLGELLVGIALGNLPAIGVPQLAPLIKSGGVTLLAQLGAQLLLFEVGTLGSWLGPRIVSAASRLRAVGAQLGVALGICFALSWAANAVGLAAIVGAFAAGSVLEPDKTLLAELRPITSLLAPLFFTRPAFIRI